MNRRLQTSCRIGLSMFFLAFSMGSSQSLAESKIWNFDKEKTQALPTGWLSEHTGQGTNGNWVVLADPSAPSQPNVLAQTSADNTSYRFPLAIVDNTHYKDLDMSVRFKTIAGQEDQGAGLVWRYRDANNYYIVRGNALEDNGPLQGGKRKTHCTGAERYRS